MKKVKMNTKGFTLMEVLISIAVVGLLFAPMLSFFSHSARMNVNAKNMQRANTVAQSVMEEVRSYDTIADMVATYEDTVNTNLMRTKDDKFNAEYSAPVVTTGGGFSNETYYFVHKGLENDGKKYTAKITVDSGAYKALNDIDVPVISSLGSGSTVMAAEKDETMNALYEYQSRYHSAPENNGNSISLDELAEKLEKKVKVKITDDGTLDGMIKVTIYNEYSIDNTDGVLHGCTDSIQSEYLYNEEVVYEKLKGIYLFYNYDVFTQTKDTIFQGIDVDVEYLSHPEWTYDYTLYAICQKVYSVSEDISLIDDAMISYADTNKTSKTVITKKIRKNGSWPGSYDGVVDVFSNYNYKVRYDHNPSGGYVDETSISANRKTMDTIVKSEKIQRLSEVTVQIYDSNNDLCAELKSTRGE